MSCYLTYHRQVVKTGMVKKAIESKKAFHINISSPHFLHSF